MRMDEVAQRRRTNGIFDSHRVQRQPRAALRLQPLRIENAAQLFTVALLLGACLPATAGQAARTAMRAGTYDAGMGGNDYTGVEIQQPLMEATHAVAAGCLARPRSCPQLVCTAAVSAAVGAAAGGWLGWRAGRDGVTATPDRTPEPPGAAAALVQPEPTPAPARSEPASMRLRPADLDPARDPCDSLHAHVNARWRDRTALAAGETRLDTSSLLQERSFAVQQRLAEAAAAEVDPTPAQWVVGDLWRSGMDARHINAEGLRPLRAELAAIEGLASCTDIGRYLAELSAKARNPLFALQVRPDQDNSATLMPYAMPGGLGLPDRAYYLDARHARVLQVYRDHIAALLRLSGIAEATALSDAEDVCALEQRLARTTTPWHDLQLEPALSYHPLRVDEADILTPNFSWSALFDALRIPATQRLSLTTPGFHQEVSAALADTHPGVWRAYLRFHALDGASAYLDDGLVNAQHAFQQQLLNLELPLPSREQRVLAAIEEHAGTAMGELYAAAQFTPRARARVAHMVAQLRSALRRRLRDAAWLDEETRAVALGRADRLNPWLGSPDRWPDWSGVNTEACGYLRNLRRLRAHALRSQIAQLGQAPDPAAWRVMPQTPGAYFDVLNNNMVFSAALLQPPVFDVEADDALNYGAAGVIIAHEMAHAFSLESSAFGLDGTINAGWNEAVRQRYAALSTQLAAQFDQQRIDGLAVNGALTGEENMADLGGLAIALDALQAQTRGQPDPMIDGSSREQRFFMSWALVNRRLQTRYRLVLELAADPHASGAPRSDVGPSNLPAYAAAFGCPAGRSMVRTGGDRVAFL